MANNAKFPRAASPGAILQRITQKVFGQIGASGTTSYAITVPDSTPELLFQVTMPFLDANLFIANAYCTTAGTVTLVLGNASSSPITASTQDFYISSK